MRESLIVPDVEILDAMRSLGGRCTARALCDLLTQGDRRRGDCQLSIQRAMDRRIIDVEDDWSLSIGAEAPTP